ncbi:MAG: YggT family protein [Promicromonosporaceae bacterium]|nr:YggT family protein [Promicromonosporaceae bacterium]
MSATLNVIGLLLWLYLICLALRLVMDWLQRFARQWRPKGVMLLAAEGVYTITDPPLNLVRRLIPPLRLGQVSLDLAFMLVFFMVIVASTLLSGA